MAELMPNWFELMSKLAEAQCLRFGIKVQRRFTDEELEDTMRRLVEAERSLPKCDLCGRPTDFDERTCYRCASGLYGDEDEPDHHRNEDERLDDPRHGQANELNRRR